MATKRLCQTTWEQWGVSNFHCFSWYIALTDSILLIILFVSRLRELAKSWMPQLLNRITWDLGSSVFGSLRTEEPRGQMAGGRLLTTGSSGEGAGYSLHEYFTLLWSTKITTSKGTQTLISTQLNELIKVTDFTISWVT